MPPVVAARVLASVPGSGMAWALASAKAAVRQALALAPGQVLARVSGAASDWEAMARRWRLTVT